MRLIDADAMKARLEMAHECDDCDDPRACRYDSIYAKRDFCIWIDDEPTVEERKTAKWEWVEEESGTAQEIGEPIYDAHFQCSECGFRPFENLNGDEVLTTYCPHCGARMMEIKEG